MTSEAGLADDVNVLVSGDCFITLATLGDSVMTLELFARLIRLRSVFFGMFWYDWIT
jgi:hypothetical protein